MCARQHIGLNMFSPMRRPKRIYQMTHGVLNLPRNLLLDWLFGHSLINCHVEHHLFPFLSDHMCLKVGRSFFQWGLGVHTLCSAQFILQWSEIQISDHSAAQVFLQIKQKNINDEFKISVTHKLLLKSSKILFIHSIRLLLNLELQIQNVNLKFFGLITGKSL